jgi:hypothetical protein
VEQLDRLVGKARIDGLAQKPEWHRVIVLVDLDVVVGRDASRAP